MQQQVLRRTCLRAHQRGQDELIFICLHKDCEQRLSCINCSRDGCHKDHLIDVFHLDHLPQCFEKRIVEYKSAGIPNIVNVKKKEFYDVKSKFLKTLNELESEFLKSMNRVEQADKLVMESIKMVETKDFTNLNEYHAQTLVSLKYNQLEDQWRKFMAPICQELQSLHAQLVNTKKSESNVQFCKKHCKDKFLLSAFLKNRLNYNQNYQLQMLLIEEKVQELNGVILCYFGGFKDGLKHGIGIQINHVNKEILEGIWDSNEMIWGEQMKKTNQQCFSMSTGEFRNGQLDSKGLVLYSNGDNYDCEFRNSSMPGFGIFQYSNGDVYEGEYIYDTKQGKGMFRYSNGDIYNGFYKNDKKEGKGILNYQNGDVYDGQFINDQKEGKGIFRYSNGDIYNGYFKNDKKQGKGIYTYQNGDIFDGEYQDDKKQGNGIIQYSNKEYFKGYFNNDKTEGLGHYISQDGKIITIEKKRS